MRRTRRAPVRRPAPSGKALRVFDEIRGLARRLERRATRSDGTLDRAVVGATLAVCYLLFVPTYLAVNLYSVGRPAHILWLPGEAELVPFVPEAEFIYVLGYLLPLIVLLRIPDARHLTRLAVAFTATLAVAYATYLVFPVYLERPALDVTSVATLLLSLEYTDPSYNHFPSLHMATAVLLYLACRDGLRRPGFLLALVAAIGFSTMLVKQHYLIDLVYGALLAAAAWWAAGLCLAGRVVSGSLGPGEKGPGRRT